MAKSKLTESQITEIKEMYANGGVTHGELAETYGVGIATIRRILAGVKGKDDVTISTSKTVTKVLTVEEKIELLKQQLAEAEASKQDALEARYIELGKWAEAVIGNADVSDYMIVKKKNSSTITTDDNVGQGLTYTGDKPYTDESSDGNDNDNEDEAESTDSVNVYNESDAETDNENTFTDDEVTNNDEDDNNTTGELDVEKWLN